MKKKKCSSFIHRKMCRFRPIGRGETEKGRLGASYYNKVHYLAPKILIIQNTDLDHL